MNKIESEFEHQGLLCVVVTTDLGHRCGYVRVTVSHPWFEKSYNKCPVECDKSNDGYCDHSPEHLIDIHGGLTFSASGKEGHPIDGIGWWFGFDCAHSCDAKDFSIMSERGREMFSQIPDFNFTGSSIKDQSFVEAECKKLAEQLASVRVTA